MHPVARCAVAARYSAAFALALLAHRASQADEPRLALDVAAQEAAVLMVSDCLPVGPDEQLVAVRVRVSTLVLAGGDEALESLLVTIRGPGRRARVVDYAPRTEMGSDVVGTIGVVENSTRDRGASADVKATIRWPLGLGLIEAFPQASASTSDQQQTSETYERLPPQELLAASGTTDGGYGAMFKLRRSSQVSLEGTHDLALLLAVPRSWRGDWLVVNVAADGAGEEHGGWSDDDDLRTVVTRLVGLHLDGDGEAQALAAWLGQAQGDYLAACDASGADPIAALLAARRGASRAATATSPRRTSLLDVVLGRSDEATAPARQSLEAAITALDEIAGAATAL
jgi:hypothetical protein